MDSKYKASLDELKDLFVWESVPWLADAACRQPDADVSWWFKKGSNSIVIRQRKKAKLICVRDCPVRWQCLARYIEEPFGIFGGFDEKERKQFRETTHYTKWHVISALQKRFLGAA